MKNILAVLALSILLTACLLDAKVDASSDETTKESITKVMKGLSLEDQEKFQQSLKIIMFADINNIMDMVAVGKDEAAFMAAFRARIDGKTGKEVIALAEKVSKEKASGKKADDAHPTDISDLKKDAEKEAKADLIGKIISAKLTGKKVVSGDYDKKISISILFKNIGDKNIKGIKGVAYFKDMFGDTIQNVSLSLDETINAGQEYEYKGYLDLNRFKDDDLKMAGTSLEKIDFSFKPTIIIFEDNTRIEAEIVE